MIYRSDERKELLSLIELDTIFSLDQKLQNHSIQWPSRNLHEKHIIQQVMGYMCHNRIKYAMLSSFDSTWFMYREGLYLFTSPRIPYDSVEPTLFRCIGYFTC